MKIAGLQKCSFVDYPGQLAAVFFTSGCNWRCFHCHNAGLLDGTANPLLSVTDALDWLDTRKGLLGAVVVSGGEPTLQPGLPAFVREVRARGFCVKLDTNGSRPTVLRELLAEGALDYVAMDLKAPMDKYEYVTGIPVEQNALNESIDLIMGSGIDHEFRATVIPQLTHDDVLAMARRVRGARRFVLQQYRRPAGVESDGRLELVPHAAAWPAPILPQLAEIVEHCDLRGFAVPAESSEVSAA